MRRDESFVTKAIENAFIKGTTPSYSIEPLFDGNDPPDYLIHFDNVEIGLEVTRCGAYVSGENPISRESVTTPIHLFMKGIQKEYSKHVEEPYTITFHLQGPISHFRKFKREFSKFIKGFIDNKTYIECHGHRELEIGDEVVKISIKGNRELSPNHRLLFNIGIKRGYHNSNIQEHVKKALESVINNKIEKMKKSKHTNLDKKWLGILNTNPIADQYIYDEIDRDINADQYFDKIFIIFDTGEVFEFV